MANKIGGLNKARGLESLISQGRAREKTQTAETPEKAPEESKGFVTVKLSRVIPNTTQPRTEFDEAALKELADSIAKYGVISPLLVQKKDDYYEIIAGERRWRAAKMAGIKEVPVVIKDYSAQETLEVSLIENIQREDLNPLEEAHAYRRLVEEYGLTQEEVADKVSKSRAAITNSLRLLKLDERVQKMLIDGLLTNGHARALLGLEDKDAQAEAANQVAVEGLSVRETEKLVKNYGRPKRPIRLPDPQLEAVYGDLEEKLMKKFGTKVSVKHKMSGKGSIEIEYYSTEEFDRLLELFGQIETEGD